MKIWHTVRFTVPADCAEAAEFALNRLESLGTEYGLANDAVQDTVSVTGYFDSVIDEAAARRELTAALAIYGWRQAGSFLIEIGTLEERDWLAEWKKSWRPTLTRRFAVTPNWEEGDFGSRIVIRIDPGMAFGTGTHATTRLCLKALEDNYAPGLSLLDIGTGTGILAIAAARLYESFAGAFAHSRPEEGKQPVIVACDTDGDAVTIAKRNAEANGVGHIRFFTGSVTEETPSAGLVLANLTADVIRPLLPLIWSKTNAVLVLSGILAEQESILLSAMENAGCPEPLTEIDGEWISMTLRRETVP